MSDTEIKSISDSDFQLLELGFLIKAGFNFAVCIIILAWSGNIVPYIVICFIMIIGDITVAGFTIYTQYTVL